MPCPTKDASLILHDRIFTGDPKIGYDHLFQDYIDGLLCTENPYIAQVIKLCVRELAWKMPELLTFVRRTYWLAPRGHLLFLRDKDVVS